MGPLWFPLYLLLLAELHLSFSQNLTCLNDYINKVTCTWDSKGVPPATVCSLHGLYKSRTREIKDQCTLEPLNGQNPALRKCHFVFNGLQFSSSTKIPIHVNCEKETNPVAQIKIYKPYLNIQMNPPGAPNISNYTISWSPGSPFSKSLAEYTFQLQYKLLEQQWKEGYLINILDKATQQQLPEERLEKEKIYQVRVRVGPQDGSYKGEWSQWSPITSWRSEVGKEPPRTGEVIGSPVEKDRLLIGCGAALLVLLAAISITVPIRHICVYKVSCAPVPNPSKYFDVLNSIHGGDFQKWLNPVFSAQSFDVLQYSEDISRVEVSSTKDTNALIRKDSATASEQQDISGQSPSFSNISYFYSSYPYKVETLPACSSDQPAEGTAEQGKDGPGVTSIGSIQMSSSYECLQKLINQRRKPMHPDSGVGVGSDDQEDTEDEAEDGEETEGGGMQKHMAPCSDPLAFLPFLSPFGKHPFHVPFPQHPSAFPNFPFPLPNKGAEGLVQPCDEGYMP